MIIYRPHCLYLSDGMRLAREFVDENAMKDYIAREAPSDAAGSKYYDKNDIVLDEDQGEDDRIGWHDVRMVCVNRFGSEDYIKLYGSPQCIGYYATSYKSTSKEEKK